MKIDVTYVVAIVDEGEDEEFSNMMSEDGRFVVTGLPIGLISRFWKKIKSIHGCSQRPEKTKKHDGRLRVNWNQFCNFEDFLQAKKKLLEIIKHLVPDAKIRYRQFGSCLYQEIHEYDLDDQMLLEGAFTDEEKTYLPLDQRARILNITS